MTTEEKAMAYAENRLRTAYPNMTLSRLDKAVDLFDTYDMAQAYEDGYNEALTSQWKDPKVELPEVGEWVDVCICRTNNTIKYRYEARYEGNGIFEDNDGFKFDWLSYWMRIPEPPAKGEEA